MARFYNSRDVKLTRRQLKKNMPDPESVLWHVLRGRKFRGMKFRRQYSIGRYVVDFYCPQARVAIEIEGPSHLTSEAREYDKIRRRFIENCGVTILRFTNERVVKNVDSVLKTISEQCFKNPSP